MEVDGDSTEDGTEEEENTDSDDAAENADSSDVGLALCDAGDGNQDDGNNLCNTSAYYMLACNTPTR